MPRARIRRRPKPEQLIPATGVDDIVEAARLQLEKTIEPEKIIQQAVSVAQYPRKSDSTYKDNLPLLNVTETDDAVEDYIVWRDKWKSQGREFAMHDIDFKMVNMIKNCAGDPSTYLERRMYSLRQEARHGNYFIDHLMIVRALVAEWPKYKEARERKITRAELRYKESLPKPEKKKFRIPRKPLTT